MLIPIGLGTKPARMPVATLLIIAATMLFYAFDNPDSNFSISSSNQMIPLIEERLTAAANETNLADNLNGLFLEYCNDRAIPIDRCKNYTLFVIPNAHPILGRGDLAVFGELEHQGEVDYSKFSKFVVKQSVALENTIQMLHASPSDPLYIDQQTVKRFLFILKYKPRKLKGFESYQPYLHELEKAEHKVYRYLLAGDWLTPSNRNPRSVLTAQLRHGSLHQLFATMFVVLIFGMYVEMRIGILPMFLAYFIAGSGSVLIQSKLFSDPFAPIFGATGNAYSIMAMFFVLFLHFNLKFRMLPLLSKLVSSKKIDLIIPVKVAVPILYAGDFVTTITNFEMQGPIGYYAHLGGVLIGGVIAIVIKNIYKIPFPFISTDEIRGFIALRQEDDIDLKIRRSRYLLKVNQLNFHVRRHVIKSILSTNAGVFLRTGTGRRNIYSEYIRTELPCLCAQVSELDIKLAIDVLHSLPLEVPLVDALGDIGQRRILFIADEALRSGHGFLAVRLYDTFLLEYMRSSICPDVVDSVWSILSEMPAENFVLDFLTRYEQLNKRTAIRDLVNRRRLQIQYSVKKSERLKQRAEHLNDGQEKSKAS